MPNWKKVIVSGSDAILNNITASGGANILGSTTFGSTTNNTHTFSGSVEVLNGTLTADGGGLYNVPVPLDWDGTPKTGYLTTFIDKIYQNGGALNDSTSYDTSSFILSGSGNTGQYPILYWDEINDNPIDPYTFNAFLTTLTKQCIVFTSSDAGPQLGSVEQNILNTVAGTSTKIIDLASVDGNNDGQITGGELLQAIHDTLVEAKSNPTTFYSAINYDFTDVYNINATSGNKLRFALYASATALSNTRIVKTNLFNNDWTTVGTGVTQSKDNDDISTFANTVKNIFYENLNTDLDTTINASFTVSGSITASGNISASGTIVGSNLSGTNTGDQDLSDLNTFTGSIQTEVDNLTAVTSSFVLNSSTASFAVTGSDVIFTNITASNNISASGNLFASLSFDSSNYNTVVYDNSTGQFFYTGSYGGSGGGATIDNDANNRITTAKGDGILNAEQNLSFNGSKLELTGSLYIKDNNPVNIRSQAGLAFDISDSLSANIIRLGDPLFNNNETVFTVDDYNENIKLTFGEGFDTIFSQTGLDLHGNITSSGDISSSGDLTTNNGLFSGNLTVQGDITAQQYIINSTVTNVTMSFSSGSTIFGDSTDDTHLFTGSLDITGSTNIIGPLSLPGFNDVSASLASLTAGGGADNLGNHTATQDLDMAGFSISASLNITASGNISASGDIIGNNLYSNNINIFPQTLSSSSLEILSIPENSSYNQGVIKESITLDNNSYGTVNLFKVTSSIESVTINPTIIYNPTSGIKTRIKLSLSVVPDNLIPNAVTFINAAFLYNFGSVSYSSGFTANNLGVTISPFLYNHNITSYNNNTSFWDISLSSDSQYLEFKFVLNESTTSGTNIGSSNLTSTNVDFLIPYELYKF